MILWYYTIVEGLIKQVVIRYKMDYINLIRNLPINHLYQFDDPRDWLDIYSHHYPTEDQREEIYRLEDTISSYR